MAAPSKAPAKATKSTTRKEQAKTVEAQTVLDHVKGLTPQKVVAEVSNLQLSVQGQLAEIQNSMTVQLQKLAELDTAINLKEQRLKDLFNIEAQAVTLDDLRLQIETEQKAWEADKEGRRRTWNEEETERNKRWKREDDEHAYSFSNMKKRVMEEFQAEVEKNKRAEAIRQSDLAKSWKEREDALKIKETESAELKKQVEGFDARLKTEIAKAEAIKEASLKREYQHQTALLAKDSESAKSMAAMEVKSAEAKAHALAEQVKELQTQLISARADAKEVASQALQSASGRQVADALQRVVDTRDTNTTSKSK